MPVALFVVCRRFFLVPGGEKSYHAVQAGWRRGARSGGWVNITSSDASCFFNFARRELLGQGAFRCCFDGERKSSELNEKRYNTNSHLTICTTQAISTTASRITTTNVCCARHIICRVGWLGLIRWASSMMMEVSRKYRWTCGGTCFQTKARFLSPTVIMANGRSRVSTQPKPL